MSALDRLASKLSMQDVSGYVANRKGKIVEVKPYKRDVFEEIIRAVASEYRTRAESRDTLITPMMEALARGTGGELVGLDHRLKGETRMRAKIEARLRSEGLPADRAHEVNVNDSLRYTVVYDEAEYTPGALTILERLQRFGFNVESHREWNPGDPYDGTNVQVTDPSGFPVEVQFHTPSSLALKETNHPLYEEFRAIYETDRRFDPADAARARELWTEMVANADAVPIPPGIEMIPGEYHRPFPDLPGLSGEAINYVDPMRDSALGLSQKSR